MTKHTALIIIDVQVGIISDPDYPISEAEALLGKIRMLIDKAHASQAPIIYIQHTEDDQEILGRGNPGWAIHPAISPLDTDYTVTKKTPDSFHNTKLGEILTQLEIQQLVIVGLQTEYCVDTSCRRAFSLGYKTILVKDAHSTSDSPVLSALQIIAHHNRVLGGSFVTLIDADKIIF